MYLRFSFTALFFINLIFSSCSCSLEQIIKQTLENEIKNRIVLNRQLPDVRKSVFGNANDWNFANISEESITTKNGTH